MAKRNDRKYFALTPRMACDDLRHEPLALALLVHYEQVCGQNGGVCRWSLRDTARHTGISKSKVGELRDLLERLGYIRVLRDESNPRAPAQVTLVDRWEENTRRYQGQVAGEIVVREARNGHGRGKGDGVRVADTAPKSVHVADDGVHMADTTVHQADTCPPHGQMCPPGGHPPIYKELKKQEQEQTQEPAAVVVPGKPARARAKAAPKAAAAAAADGEKSNGVGKDSQEGPGERSGKAQPAQKGEGTPKNAGGAERRASAPKGGDPVPVGDVLGQLAREAAGLDGVDAGAALRAYAENIAPLTPFLAQTVADAVADYGEDEVLEAIQEAVLYNRKNWPYIRAILRRKAGQPKASEVGLRAAKLRWLREQGVEIAETADERELEAALMEAAEWDPRRVPDFAQMQRAASR